MAVYDYKCKACGTEFEVEHPMSERGSEAKRVFVPSGIVFSGSGFYNTDQKGKK